MNFKKQVDSCLGKMREAGGTGKGTFGEEAVFHVCEELYQLQGGLLYHSFSYKTDKALPGNIKRGPQGTLYLENLGSSTEIDILYCSKYKIFPIEVKAYKAKEIIVTDGAIEGCYVTDKSPVHQNEMHCRHLYASIFKVLPEGDEKYMEPIVCFVDKARIVDRRSKEQKEYVRVAILDNIRQVIEEHNKPDLYYEIDLRQLQKELNEIQVSCGKQLPLRVV